MRSENGCAQGFAAGEWMARGVATLKYSVPSETWYAPGIEALPGSCTSRTSAFGFPSTKALDCGGARKLSALWRRGTERFSGHKIGGAQSAAQGTKFARAAGMPVAGWVADPTAAFASSSFARKLAMLL